MKFTFAFTENKPGVFSVPYHNNRINDNFKFKKVQQRWENLFVHLFLKILI